jgi:hypothetical protein
MGQAPHGQHRHADIAASAEHLDQRLAPAAIAALVEGHRRVQAQMGRSRERPGQGRHLLAGIVGHALVPGRGIADRDVAGLVQQIARPGQPGRIDPQPSARHRDARQEGLVLQRGDLDRDADPAQERDDAPDERVGEIVGQGLPPRSDVAIASLPFTPMKAAPASTVKPACHKTEKWGAFRRLWADVRRRPSSANRRISRMTFRPFPAALALSAVLLCGAGHAAVVGTNTPAQAINAARIDALPAKDRDAWKAYLARSEKQNLADRAALAAELKPGQPARRRPRRARAAPRPCRWTATRPGTPRPRPGTSPTSSSASRPRPAAGARTSRAPAPCASLASPTPPTTSPSI